MTTEGQWLEILWCFSVEAATWFALMFDDWNFLFFYLLFITDFNEIVRYLKTYSTLAEILMMTFNSNICFTWKMYHWNTLESLLMIKSLITRNTTRQTQYHVIQSKTFWHYRINLVKPVQFSVSCQCVREEFITFYGFFYNVDNIEKSF